MPTEGSSSALNPFHQGCEVTEGWGRVETFSNVVPIESRKGSKAHALLVKALSEAENAVRLDKSKDLGKALFAYQSIVVYFMEVLQKLSDSRYELDKNGRLSASRERDKIIKLRDTYINRINILLSTLPGNYTQAYNARLFNKRMSLHPNWNYKTTSTSNTSPKKKHQPRNSVVKTFSPATIHSDNNNDNFVIFPTSNSLRNSSNRNRSSLNNMSKTKFSIEYPCRLMSTISLSILSGTNLTPNLFVPKELWSQKHHKIPEVKHKINICNMIIIHLESIQKVDVSNYSAVADELDAFIDTLENIKLLFSKRISSIDYQTKKKKYRNFSQIIENGCIGIQNSLDMAYNSNKAKLVNSVNIAFSKSVGFLSNHINSKSNGFYHYTRTLFKIFCYAQIIKNWFSYFVSAPQGPENHSVSPQSIIDRLYTVSILLSTVICTFVVKDFHLVSQNFINKFFSNVYL